MKDELWEKLREAWAEADSWKKLAHAQEPAPDECSNDCPENPGIGDELAVATGKIRALFKETGFSVVCEEQTKRQVGFSTMVAVVLLMQGSGLAKEIIRVSTWDLAIDAAGGWLQTNTTKK